MEHLNADSISEWNPGDIPTAKDNPRGRFTQIEVFSFTSFPVAISEIRGLKRICRPVGENHSAFRGGKRGVVIKFTDNHSPESKEDILALNDREFTQYSPFLRLSVEKYQNRRYDGSLPPITTVVFISEKDLETRRSVLVDAAGMLVTALPIDFDRRNFQRDIPDHPLSKRGMMKSQGDRMRDLEQSLETGEGPTFRRTRGQHESIFTQSMTVIENDETTYGKLYVRMRAPLVDDKFQVATMVATYHPSISPGLYVRTNYASIVPLKDAQLNLIHITDPVEFALYGVFQSVADAEAPDAVTLARLNNINQVTQLANTKERLRLETEKMVEAEKDHARALETAAQKHTESQQEARRKAELSEKQYEQDLRVLEAKATAAEAEAKVLREKLEFERVKDSNERSAQRLKAFVEIVKAIVGLAGSLVILFKFLQGLMPKVPLKV